MRGLRGRSLRGVLEHLPSGRVPVRVEKREVIGPVEVRQDSGYWTLYVNGEALIQRDSFTVCDRVAYELTHPGALFPSEAHEVAQAIRHQRGTE